MRTPCIIITRDRLSYTKLCLASLERFRDQLAIHIVDHGSTYVPMLEWLRRTPVDGLALLGDRGPRDLWHWSRLPDIVGDRPYLVTDPDVVLDDACPGDWLERMQHEMGHDPNIKVGLGLRIDDLPLEQTATGNVLAWESAFWNERTACGAAWKAPVDTTLSLYPPLSVQPNFTLAPAKRLDAPYLLRHLPWYGDLDPAETQYYREHALPGTSHWINGGW